MVDIPFRVVTRSEFNLIDGNFTLRTPSLKLPSILIRPNIDLPWYWTQTTGVTVDYVFGSSGQPHFCVLSPKINWHRGIIEAEILKHL